jgi:hypothetical protein
MRSYMSLAVLALAASTVPTALSAPVQYDGLHLRIRFLAFLTYSVLLEKSGAWGTGRLEDSVSVDYYQGLWRN